MRQLYIFFLVLLCSNIQAQDYASSIEKHRKEYKEEFLSSERSPLHADDIPYLRFYDADEQYVISAKFKRAVDAKPFDMATYSGITKKYITYGTLTFSIKGTTYTLNVYQSLDLIKNPEYANYLFIPFKDFTNGVETYGGGRYMDFTTSDILNDVLKIDFNKAYNPYCAYSAGYSCPIPPEENHLQTEIPAGEKKFGKDH